MTYKKIFGESLQTLKIKWPFGGTMACAVLILVCLIATSELLLRWDFIQSKVPYPSIGSANRSLDIKVHLLNKMVNQEGRPDCIFLGSSVVNSALDPKAFQEAYQATTGRRIRCFNFGINGITPYSAFKLMKILIKLYHPRMILWGLTSIDFNARKNTKKQAWLETNAWVHYQLGDGNFSGWLADKSYMYRYYLRFRFWMEFPKIARKHSIGEAGTTAYGYRTDKFRNIVDSPVEPDREAEYKKIMGDLQFDRQVLAILEKAIHLDPGTTILLVEMPIHPKSLPFYKGGKKIHQQIIKKVEGLASKNGTIFIPTTHFNLTPDKQWADYNHLNYYGAGAFSRWLGKCIGKVFNQGMLPNLQNKGVQS